MIVSLEIRQAVNFIVMDACNKGSSVTSYSFLVNLP